LVLWLLLLLADGARGEDQRHASVGMPARINQLVLPGPELEVRPLDDRKAPLVLRIAAAYPHGTAFRYDLVYYGLGPGEYDLRRFLRRKDGSDSADLPPLRVTIDAVLPPGQVEPHVLDARGAAFLSPYRLILIGLGFLWVLGLLAILFLGRRKRRLEHAGELKPVTLADRLRPLVEHARAGTMTTEQRAEVERLLLSYWRHRLALDERRPAEAFAALRRHPEAGLLLEQLEAWLHRPVPAAEVDVAALLRPYQREER
jgi:hypothetical protein